MGGQSASTPEVGRPIIPQMGPSIGGGAPQVDPLSYSDPTNMPDPLIELLRGAAGLAGYGPSAKRK